MPELRITEKTVTISCPMCFQKLLADVLGGLPIESMPGIGTIKNAVILTNLGGEWSDGVQAVFLGQCGTCKTKYDLVINTEET